MSPRLFPQIFPAAALLAATLARAFAGAEGALEIILPTENDAIFCGGGPAFYMHVNRDYKGVSTTPWEGGQYGFVRNPAEFGSRMIYTRFHEGIDIRPVRRDPKGEPLDLVRSVDDGLVVYATGPAARSGYGRYVVVEHHWHGCPYYSLYAHLNRIDVRAGQRVARGETLGLLGHTGTGIDKERAHLHFEINLLLSEKFESWHSRYFPNDPNDHGIHNGINLAGIDVARFYLDRRNDISLDVSGFLASKKPFFTVRVHAPQGIELLRRYPWLSNGEQKSATGCWDLSFDPLGLPLSARPAPSVVNAPVVIAIEPSKIPYRYLTRNLVEGSSGEARLGPPGVRLIDLILM